MMNEVHVLDRLESPTWMDMYKQVRHGKHNGWPFADLSSRQRTRNGQRLATKRDDGTFLLSTRNGNSLTALGFSLSSFVCCFFSLPGVRASIPLQRLLLYGR